MTHYPYTLSLNIDDFRQHDVAGPLNNATKELNDGEVLFHVDKLALTANSISYGFAGKSGLIDISISTQRKMAPRIYPAGAMLMLLSPNTHRSKLAIVSMDSYRSHLTLSCNRAK